MSDESATLPGPDGDGLVHLADALACYLAEVEGWRTACRRHEETVAVREAQTIRLARRFPHSPSLLAFLVEKLNRLGTAVATGKNQDEAPDGGTIRQLEWEGRLLRGSLRTAEDSGWVEVELELLPAQGALRQASLRAVASALDCHDFLVPAAVATPFRLADWPRGRRRTISQFLKRAAAQGWPTVQWIFPSRAGNCTPPGSPGREGP